MVTFVGVTDAIYGAETVGIPLLVSSWFLMSDSVDLPLPR